GIITINPTAAGFGWFVDSTPDSDSEFAPGAVNGPAQGRMDLLSVIAHEIGHHLGLGEDDGTAVMAQCLPAGVRHWPLAETTLPTAGSLSPAIVAVPSVRPDAAMLVGAPASPATTPMTTLPQTTSPETIPVVRAGHARHLHRGRQAVAVHQSAAGA